MFSNIGFIFSWPGDEVLLVWGSVALDAARKQNRGPKVLPKPQKGDEYGIVCVTNKAATISLQQLYGGKPVLVVNAEKYSYKEMSMLHQGQYGKRTVFISRNFPYWHHSFSREAEPFGFKDTEDPEALSFFCNTCLKVVEKPCQQTQSCKHNVCDSCQSFDYHDFCYHSSHKREYFEQDQTLDFLSTEMLLCDGEGCTAHVDSQIGCSMCQAGGYCSMECLWNHHVC